MRSYVRSEINALYALSALGISRRLPGFGERVYAPQFNCLVIRLVEEQAQQMTLTDPKGLKASGRVHRAAKTFR